MAREWTKVELYGANNSGDIRRYAIANGVDVSQGHVLYLLDNRTVSGAMLGSVAVAGVAAEDHPANQGITSIGCWTNGIFEAVASVAIVVGTPFCMDTHTANTIRNPATAQLASGAITAGYVLETGAADETINVRLLL